MALPICANLFKNRGNPIPSSILRFIFYRGCPISADNNLRSSSYDGIVLVSWPEAPKIDGVSNLLDISLELDPGLLTESAVIPLPDFSAGKLIHSPTGPIDPDYQDIRIFKEAAAKGIKRALKAGVKRPCLVLRKHPDFENSELVTLLGALEELYVVSIRFFSRGGHYVHLDRPGDRQDRFY